MTVRVIDGARLDAQAAVAMARGADVGEAVLVHGVHVDGETLHWLCAEHAQGWVRPDAGVRMLSPAAFEREWQAWQVEGFVPADAALLAFVRQPHQPFGLSLSKPGPGLRQAQAERARDDGGLPELSWDDQPPGKVTTPAASTKPLGIYAIVDSVPRLRQVLDAGVTTAQLRIKQPAAADASWHAGLRAELRDGIAAARDAGASLFINDHWRAAAELGAGAVHLGQEDLLALGPAGRAELRATGLALGISSHAVWELCRARTLAPRYIACGPVWPTITKAMPWRPQGLDNLGWWCGVAGVPVVAIGGILDAQAVEQAASAGADGVCIVRGLGDAPAAVVPALQEAYARGRARFDPASMPAWPHPTLEVRA